MRDFIQYLNPNYRDYFNMHTTERVMKMYIYSNIGSEKVLEDIRKAIHYGIKFKFLNLPSIKSGLAFFMDYRQYVQFNNYESNYGGSSAGNLVGRMEYYNSGAKDELINSTSDRSIWSKYRRLDRWRNVVPDLEFCWGLDLLDDGLNDQLRDYMYDTFINYKQYVYESEWDFDDRFWEKYKRSIPMGNGWNFCISGLFYSSKSGVNLGANLHFGFQYMSSFSYDISNDLLVEYQECFERVFVQYDLYDYFIDSEKLKTYIECKEELLSYLDFLNDDFFHSYSSLMISHDSNFKFKVEYKIKNLKDLGYYLDFKYYELISNSWIECTNKFFKLLAEKEEDFSEDLKQEFIGDKIMLNLQLVNDIYLG